MKAAILILSFLPIICFSQNRNSPAPVKPSTTDCPDWSDKNKPKNKADYYRSLRSKKKATGNQEMSNGLYPTGKQRTPSARTEEPEMVSTKKSVKKEPEKVLIEETPIKEKEIKKDTVAIAESGSSSITTKEKSKEEEKVKKKPKKLPRRKTTKAHKRNKTGCPDF